MFQTQVNYRGLAIAAVLTKSSKLKFSSPMCLSLNPETILRTRGKSLFIYGLFSKGLKPTSLST